MITVLRFIALLVLYVMSVAMVASILHGYDHWGPMNLLEIDWEALMHHAFWPAVILGLCVILMSTPIGDMIIGLFLATRRQTLRDEEKLGSVLEMLKNRYKEKFGVSINPKTYVMDLPSIDGIAYGRRAMALSTGLLKTASDEEIAGILAHEMGHLHHRDGFFNIAIMVASMPFYTIQYMLGKFLWYAMIGDEKSGGDDFIVMLVMNILILFFFSLSCSSFYGALAYGLAYYRDHCLASKLHRMANRI